MSLWRPLARRRRTRSLPPLLGLFGSLNQVWNHTKTRAWAVNKNVGDPWPLDSWRSDVGDKWLLINCRISGSKVSLEWIVCRWRIYHIGHPPQTHAHGQHVKFPFHICSCDNNFVGSETFPKKSAAFSKPYQSGFSSGILSLGILSKSSKFPCKNVFTFGNDQAGTTPQWLFCVQS